MEEIIDFVVGVLFCKPELKYQLGAVAFWGLLWFFSLPLLAVLFRKTVVDPHPRKKQWIKLNQDMLKKSFMISLSFDATYYFACDFAAIMFQHFVGGLLCIPSLLSTFGGITLVSPQIATAMACHGALCEAGWEIEDSLYRIYQVAFQGEEGRKMNPPSIFVILGLHHSLTLSLVIPMNLSIYRLSPEYHELVMMFQLAAACALFMQQCGFFLDISTPGGIYKMMGAVLFTWSTIMYTRFVRALPLFYSFIMTFKEDGADRFFYGAVVTGSLMMLFNSLIALDGTLKLYKFTRLSILCLTGKLDLDKEKTGEEEDEKDDKKGKPKSYAQYKMLREASSGALLGNNPLRPYGSFESELKLSPAKKRWSKLKTAVAISGLVAKKKE